MLKQAEKKCETCKWWSDDFTSVCVNDASPHCADFVMADDVCHAWEEANDKRQKERIGRQF